MPTLYMMVGAPGSGKSTWAQKFVQDHPEIAYISRDVVRAEKVRPDEPYFSHETAVFNTFARRCATWLSCGHDVIADATHNMESSRNKLLRALDKYGAGEFDLIFVVMNTSMEECIKRDKNRTGRAHVTARVIKNFYHNFTFPKKENYGRCTGVWLINE